MNQLAICQIVTIQLQPLVDMNHVVLLADWLTLGDLTRCQQDLKSFPMDERDMFVHSHQLIGVTPIEGVKKFCCLSNLT